MRHPYFITMCLTQMNLAAGQFWCLQRKKKKKEEAKGSLYTAQEAHGN